MLMLVLPVLSVIIDGYTGGGGAMDLAGKWFVFWSVGIRLLTAGLKQVIQPAFTAEKIFHLSDRGSFVVVKELGFSNICFGALGIASLFLPSWRMAAAATGGLFFGIAGVTHIFKKPAGANEWIALVSDVFMAVVLGAYVILRSVSGIQ